MLTISLKFTRNFLILILRIQVIQVLMKKSKKKKIES